MPRDGLGALPKNNTNVHQEKDKCQKSARGAQDDNHVGDVASTFHGLVMVPPLVGVALDGSKAFVVTRFGDVA